MGHTRPEPKFTGLEQADTIGKPYEWTPDSTPKTSIQFDTLRTAPRWTPYGSNELGAGLVNGDFKYSGRRIPGLDQAYSPAWVNHGGGGMGTLLLLNLFRNQMSLPAANGEKPGK